MAKDSTNNYLNQREEQVMYILWKLKKAFVKEILAEMPHPKPPYNTISSIVRKLEDRGIVGYEAFGKTHRYYPILTKQEYRGNTLKNLVGRYFGGSIEQVVSFFVEEEQVNPDEIKELLEKIKKNDEGK